MKEKLIYKYKLAAGRTTLSMPSGAQILKAELQSGDICVWAMFPVPNTQAEDRTLIVAGTGEKIQIQDSEALHYVGTVFPGVIVPIVLHVFEVRPTINAGK